ncbi:MAG: hypothetical protein WCH98_22130 [Verrucomicrobiota bacterium]
MPNQPPVSPFVEFLQALEAEEIRSILIGMMAAVEQGAPTFYELRDGTQINVVFEPVGLRSFATEFKTCRVSRVEGFPMRVLPLSRVIASKRKAARDKDLAVLPILDRTLRLSKKLKKR